MRLLGYHSGQLGTQGLAGDLHEPQPRVEREVPGHSPERRQGQHDVPGDGRPVAHRSDESRAQAAAPVRRVDVNFFEMGQVVGEHFHQREAHGRVPRRGHPQPPIRAASANVHSSVVSASTDSGAWPLSSWAAASSIAGSAEMCSARAEYIE